MKSPSSTKLPSFDVVLFGGTGDLSMRKLLPAFYFLEENQQISDDSQIICLGREFSESSQYLAQVEKLTQAYVEHETGRPVQKKFLDKFLERVQYLQFDVYKPESFAALKAMLNHGDTQKIFYLATGANLFNSICDGLAQQGLNQDSRIVLEKPLGYSLRSSEEINAHVAKYFDESQIYRIDHYLGKEAVQNLMALRFGNTLFETLWRRQWVSHVQITVSETVGVERRAEFYDQVGAMRDMVQNHLLQLLSIVAMEPPSSIEPDAVRDEKVKVLQALKPIEGDSVFEDIIRAQYRAGMVDGHKVPGYLDEENVPNDSSTETFLAIRAFVNNWRWAGVPFYLRTGKRLQERLAEIVVHFREVPHLIFPKPAGTSNPANHLVIGLQPDEALSLNMLAKRPGDQIELQPVMLDLNFAESFKTRSAQAYERLLSDAIRGRLTLFVRRDEGKAAWNWVEPILSAWQASPDSLKHYRAGSWGPSQASNLISRDGYCWHEEM